MKKAPQKTPPIFVVFGDEEFQKSRALHGALDRLLPPEVDRAMALCDYDGERSPEQGGPDFATVMDDLATLPFLADRRVVLIRDADKFISAFRERLEKYLESPSPTGTLVLSCRSFPRNTRLHKSTVQSGGEAIECKKLRNDGLASFVIDECRARGKRIAPPIAAKLVELVGQDQGILLNEAEKLCLYAADRDEIVADDIADLVGLTREEKIFAVMDAAGSGRLAEALRMWEHVLATDPAAVYKALGGIAFVIRRWLSGHQMLESGMPIHEVAPKLGFWKRQRELDSLLRRLPIPRLKRILATLAELDSQAKVGLRSIDKGVEALLVGVAE